MIRRTDVTRLTLAQLRTSYPPRVFSAMKSVHIQCGESIVDVELAVLPECTRKSGARRWLLCPSCQRKTNVIGFVSSNPMKYGCRACLMLQVGHVPPEDVEYCRECYESTN